MDSRIGETSISLNNPKDITESWVMGVAFVSASEGCGSIDGKFTYTEGTFELIPNKLGVDLLNSI